MITSAPKIRAHIKLSHGYLKRHAAPEYNGTRNYLNQRNTERREYWAKAVEQGKIKPLTARAIARLSVLSPTIDGITVIEIKKRRLQ